MLCSVIWLSDQVCIDCCLDKQVSSQVVKSHATAQEWIFEVIQYSESTRGVELGGKWSKTR